MVLGNKAIYVGRAQKNVEYEKMLWREYEERHQRILKSQVDILSLNCVFFLRPYYLIICLPLYFHLGIKSLH